MIFSPIEQFNLVSFSVLFFSNLNLFYCLIFFIYFIFVRKLQNPLSLIISKTFFTNTLVLDFYFIKNFKLFILNYIPTLKQYIIENLIMSFIISLRSLVSFSNNLNIFLYTFLTSIFFILISNLVGLIPYTYTITAQIFITINLSLLIFITYNVLGIFIYKNKFISLVIPSGVNLSLHFILIPIECISYIFRPISLSIRLFANIMAGHTLLKVICSFIFKFVSKTELSFLLFPIIPFFIIVILFGLESFVALVQSYVFFILMSLFLKDILYLH